MRLSPIEAKDYSDKLKDYKNSLSLHNSEDASNSRYDSCSIRSIPYAFYDAIFSVYEYAKGEYEDYQDVKRIERLSKN